MNTLLQDLGFVPEKPDETESNAVLESEEDADDGKNAEDSQGSGNGGCCPREEELNTSSGSGFTGFMHWSSFEPHSLSRNADIVDDRKSIVAIASGVKIGAPTPIGPVTSEGFL